MKRWLPTTVLLLCLGWLAGCASVPPVPPDESVFDDRLFPPPAEHIGAEGLFTVTPAMRRYVDEKIVPLARLRNGNEALIEALYTRDLLHLEYDSAYTRTAQEAFEARMGNCLSLVVMTAAFAREMGLQVRFQEVPRATTWDRSGDLYFLVGHVNLALGPGLRSGWTSSSDAHWLVVDFLPGQDLKLQRSRTIDEERIRAMYMNNRAAEAMTRGRLADAYWWLRGAFAQDRGYANTFNTLGVLYRRHGALAAAERALRHALAHQPGNAHALGNLVGTLQAQGRQAEAAELALQLQKLQPEQPYELFRQAMVSLQAGDFARARQLLEREIDKVADNHEFHFWLAVAHLKMGDRSRAQRHLQLALENSPTRARREGYAGKFEQLRATVPR